MTCSCGNASTFEQCCGPILSGARRAASAEALMRARYSAYARGEVDFLFESQAPEGRAGTDRAATERWSREATWLGLAVLRTQGGGPADQSGTVEFVARYRHENQDVEHHEIATFRKEGDTWYFVDGQPPKQQPFRREERKIGPNEPCTCGSGKKWKKCCAKAAKGGAAP